MKRVSALAFALLFFGFTKSSHSQYYNNSFTYEFGIGAGGMNCITDIGGANTNKTFYLNEIRFKNTKLSGSFFGSILYQNMFGVRVEGAWGAVQSADSDITGKSVNARSKTVRNLSFRSTISEISVLVEFHPLLLKHYANYPPLLSPYLVAGVGIFSFNPQAMLQNRYIDLHPLHTEGQDFAEYKNMPHYSTTGVNVQVGAGFRYEASDAVNLRLEFNHRFLFTDYLDDVSNRDFIDPGSFSKNLNAIDAARASQLYNRSLDGTIPAIRGNPTNNDAYMSISLKVGLVLRRKGSY